MVHTEDEINSTEVYTSKWLIFIFTIFPKCSKTDKVMKHKN